MCKSAIDSSTYSISNRNSPSGLKNICSDFGPAHFIRGYSKLILLMKKLLFTLCLLSSVVVSHLRADNSPSVDTAKDSTIVVSVLGSVNRPGLAYISSDGSLVGAIAACGGWIKTANVKKVSVLHGKSGEKPEKTEYDLTLILDAQKPNPKLSNGDIVYVPDRLF